MHTLFLRIQKRLRTNPQPPCVQENESLCFFECFLRANSVLSHINYYGYYDNQTLDYLCQVIVNTQKNEAVVDAEDQDTGQYPGHAADTACLRSATDGSCCDCIELVLQTVGRRVSRTGTSCQHCASQTGYQTAPHVGENQVLFYIDACYARCLTVAADCEDVLAEAALRHHEPRNDKYNQEDEYNHRNAADFVNGEITEALIQIGYRLIGVHLCQSSTYEL